MERQRTPIVIAVVSDEAARIAFYEGHAFDRSERPDRHSWYMELRDADRLERLADHLERLAHDRPRPYVAVGGEPDAVGLLVAGLPPSAAPDVAFRDGEPVLEAACRRLAVRETDAAA